MGMTSSRDDRNFKKGYQNAMFDIWEAMRVGGMDRVGQWLQDNSDIEYQEKNFTPWDEPDLP